MTTDDFIINLNQTLTNPKVLAEAFQVAVLDLVTREQKRIFVDGKNSNDTKIGDYSTKPMLVGAKSFINKGTADKFFKRKDNKWKTIQRGGNNYPLAVLDGGYKELRRLTPRKVDFVNLKYTDDLFFDFAAQRAGGDHNPIKINDFEFQITVGARPKSKIKVDGNEKRFNAPIFQPSKTDQSHFLETLNVELQRRLNAK